MGDIEQLLNLSVAAKQYVIREASGSYNASSQIDLSQIDFDALRAHFEQAHKHTEMEKLRSAINAKLTHMVRLNKSRASYQEEFQRLIDEYNAGSANVELTFEKLIAFTRGLNAEDQRHIAEQLNEEELAVFDMLTKLDVQLTDKEKDEDQESRARSSLDVETRKVSTGLAQEAAGTSASLNHNQKHTGQRFTR